MFVVLLIYTNLMHNKPVANSKFNQTLVVKCVTGNNLDF